MQKTQISEQEEKAFFLAVTDRLEQEKGKLLKEAQEIAEKNRTFIIIRDSFLPSLISDLFTFGGLVGVLAINHAYFNDSLFGAIMLGIMFFVAAIGKANNSNKVIKIKGKAALIHALEVLKKEL